MECKHKYVVKTDGSYIPDYRTPQSTAQGQKYASVPQWKCICCGQTFGYLNERQVVIPNCYDKGLSV